MFDAYQRAYAYSGLEGLTCSRHSHVRDTVYVSLQPPLHHRTAGYPASDVLPQQLLLHTPSHSTQCNGRGHVVDHGKQKKFLHFPANTHALFASRAFTHLVLRLLHSGCLLPKSVSWLMNNIGAVGNYFARDNYLTFDNVS